jgi:hypothetical protein
MVKTGKQRGYILRAIPYWLKSCQTYPQETKILNFIINKTKKEKKHYLYSHMTSHRMILAVQSCCAFLRLLHQLVAAMTDKSSFT